ncbi:MAG: primosomal protein N' [Candidatus Omnitrophota bacterium]
MYAKIVFNLPIDGPFDYYIPPAWEQNLRPGMRARVSFGSRHCFGYVVGKAERTRVKNIKPVLKIIDDVPVLDKALLKLTRQVSDYYACSWGEAIETAIPTSLRKGKRIELDLAKKHKTKNKKAKTLLLQDLSRRKVWEIYPEEINKSLSAGEGVIFLTPDRESARLIQKEIRDRLNNVEVGLIHSYLSEKEELKQWLEARSGRTRVVVGTRMAIFAPLANLGLIIIEEEQSPVYKHDAVPHYNAVGVAEIRSGIEKAKLILSSPSPRLETWHRAKRGRIKYILKDAGIPAGQIKLIDMQRVGFIPQRRKLRISISLEDAINQALAREEKVLLFLNRRGFAIFARCQNCDAVLRCPRCNANLILHFKDGILICHRCNYKAQSPRVCPNCNSGYIRYSGLGTEKLESELCRIYPQTEIARLDKDEKTIPAGARILIATESIFKHPHVMFDLVGVISLDALLNRPDFRAAEKVFDLLLRLACLSSNFLIIQTNFPGHYCFQALSQKNADSFYQTELKLRRESGLPPFNHIIAIKLRGRKEEKVADSAEELFNILNKTSRDKAIKIVSYSSSMPHKRRDRFYEQVLVKTKSVPEAVKFLKKSLSKFRRSGIIVTVDVDPV